MAVTRGIYGLSGSGIDVDSMVKVGMMTQQSQYDKMYKQEVKNEWTKEAYASLYSDLNTFNQSTLSSYNRSSKTSPMLATSTTQSVATAVANADAVSMSHTVNVTGLASNAYLLTGSEGIARANTSSSAADSAKLKDILFTEDQQKDLLAKITKQDGADRAEIDSTDALLSFDISDGKETQTISFSYADILTSDETLNDLASRINSSGVNITASYDNTNDAFSLYQKSGGTANTIQLTVGDSSVAGADNAKNLLNDLHFHSVSQATNKDTKALESSLSADALTFANSAGTASIASTGSTYASTVGNLTEDTKLADLFTAKGDDKTAASFTINGTSVSVANAQGATVKDLLAAINGSDALKKAGITASLDNGNLAITSSDTAAKITLGVGANDTSDEAANGRALVNALKFDAASDLTAGYAQNGASGTSGQVTIDGKQYSTDTGKVSVGGVTYSVLAEGSSTVTVSQDTDKLIENVQSFVDDYNKMFDNLVAKYNETQYSDYGVLTKSQENAMTQDQIDKWNDKAKSGLLYHDETLGKLISSLREAIYTPVDSVDSNYNSMMSIGITSSTDQGHLSLDTDKLKKALAADPTVVTKLFSSFGDVTTTKPDGTTTTTTDYGREGVLNRISDAFHTNLATMKDYAGNSTETSDGSTLGTLIEQLRTKMSDFQVQMDAFEESLYDKYDSMESMIQQLSVQMGYITGGN